MRLVVDANIFVSELIRRRGQALIAQEGLELFVAEVAWGEAAHELNKRVNAMVAQGKFTEEVGETVLSAAFALAQAKATLIPEFAYIARQEEALLRVPRDPNDWPTVALALALEADIWTADSDFLGCGVATWTSETLLSYLGWTGEYDW